MQHYRLPAILKNAILLDQFAILSKLVSNNNQLAIDLTHIEAIDSAGIAMLIEINNMAKALKHQIYFYNPSQIVTDFCNLYKLVDLIPFTHDKKNT